MLTVTERKYFVIEKKYRYLASNIDWGEKQAICTIMHKIMTHLCSVNRLFLRSYEHLRGQ